MPWEHALVGYIGYSVLVRLLYREPPTAGETVVVGVASLLPDLIDKPLAWGLNLFTSGYAFAHSLFVAIPLAVAVLLIARRQRNGRRGIAFAVGYLLHLSGDVLPQYARAGTLPVERLLWPVRGGGSGYDNGFGGEATENVIVYARWIAAQLQSGSPDPYLMVMLAIGVAGVLLWVADGMPVAREVYSHARTTFRRVWGDGQPR